VKEEKVLPQTHTASGCSGREQS